MTVSEQAETVREILHTHISLSSEGLERLTARVMAAASRESASLVGVQRLDRLAIARAAVDALPAILTHGSGLTIADAVLALPAQAGCAKEGWQERALKIIADEEAFAAKDEPGNIQLHVLRVARVGTAKQILGLIRMSDAVIAEQRPEAK